MIGSMLQETEFDSIQETKWETRNVILVFGNLKKVIWSKRSYERAIGPNLCYLYLGTDVGY